MGMCKGCNETFFPNEMINGYCKDCNEDSENNKQIIECKKCKTINKITSNFCKYCGERLEKNIEINTPIQETEEKTINKEVPIKEEKSVSESKSDKKVLDENSKFSSKKENKDSNADELLKWAELLEKGLIDKEDFDKKKKELL